MGRLLLEKIKTSLSQVNKYTWQVTLDKTLCKVQGCFAVV